MAKLKTDEPKLSNGQGTDVTLLAGDLAQLLWDEGLVELSVKRDGHFLRLRRKREARPSLPDSDSFEAVASQEPSGEPQEAPELGIPVTSQVVGLFYPSGRAIVGASVKDGEILGYVESMSIRHEQRSPCQGSLLELLASEGEPVEYGQALLLINPEPGAPAEG